MAERAVIVLIFSYEKFIVIHIIEQEESEKYADQKYISKLYKYHVLISNFILSRSARAPGGEARKPPFENSPIGRGPTHSILKVTA